MGNIGLAINQNAMSINEFVSPESDFLRDIIRASYTRSRCYHLHSTININEVLDILGERAYQLNNQQSNGHPSGDLLDIELLEEIAWHINERFINFVNLPTRKNINRSSAQVINLPSVRIRRANRQL